MLSVEGARWVTVWGARWLTHRGWLTATVNGPVLVGVGCRKRRTLQHLPRSG